MPFQTLCSVWKGMSFPKKMPFHILMPFHALPNPNMIWQSIEGHALPNISICRSVWKGMPFYALLYHIGVRKGMEGHWDVHQRTLYYFVLHHNTEGHALPNTTRYCNVWKGMALFTLIISWGGSEGQGRAFSCGVKKGIWILREGLMKWNFGKVFL